MSQTDIYIPTCVLIESAQLAEIRRRCLNLSQIVRQQMNLFFHRQTGDPPNLMIQLQPTTHLKQVSLYLDRWHLKQLQDLNRSLVIREILRRFLE